MRKIFDRMCLWADGIEFALPATLAALALVIGPLLAVAYFIRTQHWLAAGFLGGLWFMAALSCIRDVRRGSFGWISGALGILWFIMTVIIWWKIEDV